MKKHIQRLMLATTLLAGCQHHQQQPSTPQLPSTQQTMLEVPDVVLLGLPGEPDASLSEGPLIVLHQESGERITPLLQDVPAPYNGVLFNGSAVARLTVEFRAQQQRCSIERTHDYRLLAARYDADQATMALALSSQVRQGNLLLRSRDRDNANLRTLLEAQQTNSGSPISERLAWAGGGLLAGILIVGGIVIFTNIN